MEDSIKDIYENKQQQLRFQEKYKSKLIDFVPIKSINGFEFSKGLLDIVGNNKENQIQIASFMQINQNKKKQEIKQKLFYDRIKCSDLFIDFYFAEKNGIRDDCNEIIYQFYSSFCFSDKKDVIEHLNKSLYLNDDEILKKDFIEQICIINGFEESKPNKFFYNLKHDLCIENKDEIFFDNIWEYIKNNKRKQNLFISFNIKDSFKKTKSLLKNIQNNVCEYFLLPEELLEYFKYLTQKGRNYIFESNELDLAKFMNIFNYEMHTPNIQDLQDIYQYVTYNKKYNAYLKDFSNLTKFNSFSKNYYKLSEDLFFSLMTPTDILIIEYLTHSFTHSFLAIVYFFSIFWEENGKLEIIKNNLPQKITKFNQSSYHIIYELFVPFLHLVREDCGLEYGISIKRNIFDDSLFIDNVTDFQNNNLYIPYNMRKPNLSNDIKNLFTIKNILGKNPSCNIIDNNITTPENAIELMNVLYDTPYSLHYKEKYGSIKDALKIKL